MSSELREAAERLKDYTNAEMDWLSDELAGDSPEELKQCLRDTKLLATHYIATNPPDSEEPIDEAFWMSMFGELRPDLRNGFGLDFSPMLNEVSLRYSHWGGGGIQWSRFMPLAYITTRRQLRDLLKVLGKETQ